MREKCIQRCRCASSCRPVLTSEPGRDATAIPFSSQCYDDMDNARTGIAHLQCSLGQVTCDRLVRTVQANRRLLGHLPLVQIGWRDYLQAVAADRTRRDLRKETDGERSGSRSRFARPRRARPASSGDKGLKKNAIGFVSSVVIGVASTAPGYSLAATLGFIAAAVALQSPAILLISFVPMFLVAAGYYYMNKADPDCGTSFSWVTKAMGPQLGWIAGWTIVVADVIVMANLAQIAGLYTFLLFGWTSAAASTAAVTAVGVLWIVLMTAIVRDRDRALGPHPGRPARRRDHHPRRSSRSSPWSRSTPAMRRAGVDRPQPLLDQPVHPQPQRDLRRDAARRLHLLGLGHDRDRQRGDRRPRRGAGEGNRDQHPDPARHLPDRRRSPPKPTPGSTSWSTTRKTCSARSARKSSARPSTRS